MFDGVDPQRALAALVLVCVYAGLCVGCYRRGRRARGGGVAVLPGADWHVVYASQTGMAQILAQRACALLAHAATARCLALNELTDEMLARGGRFLFVVATAGDGEAPDNGAAFVDRVMDARPALAGVDFGVLALGDRDYPRYCAFGHRLQAWLAASGGRCCFELIEVDRGDPVAIAAWQTQVGRLAGASETVDWSASTYAPWRLVTKTHVNPGSAGTPVFRLEFSPAAGELPMWQAGDLARICLPAHPDQPRDYSIASLPGEGHLQLLVRQHVSPAGRPGLLSGWLTERMALGEQVPLHVRAHGPFRQADNASRPMILVGNGVGIAGLRAHLKARIDAGQFDNWLIFGERHRHCDDHYGQELDCWRAERRIQRLDTVFSREAMPARYVQDVLAAQADLLRAWIGRGAAIYVCGSRIGMAAAVDRVLRHIVGESSLLQMLADGRYRRDVF